MVKVYDGFEGPYTIGENKMVIYYCPDCKKEVASALYSKVKDGPDVRVCAECGQFVERKFNPFDKVLKHVENSKTETKCFEDYKKGLEISEMFHRIWKYHDELGHDTPFRDDDHRVQVIRDGCLALYQEVAELTDSFPWKPWRKRDDQQWSNDNACREMVDIIFFLAKIMRAAGITPDDLIAKFEWVLANNYSRLTNGYSLVKGGDSDGQTD